MIYGDDKEEFYEHIAKTGTTANKIFSPLYLLRMAFALLFFVTRAFEAELMLLFVKFQRMLRLESLVVERDKFHGIERRISVIFPIMLSIHLLIMIALLICFYATSAEIMMVYISLYLTCMTFFIFVIYHSLVWYFTKETYKHHRLAFHKHI